MRLSAGLTPPQAVRDDLDAVLRSVGGDPSELDYLPVHSWQIPLAGFGNVALGDAVAVGEALRREAGRWAPVGMKFSGGTALEWTGDDMVWAKLDGDLEQLGQLASAVSLVVKRLGFFVDRRKFRPWLGVGTITTSTTPDFLERLVEALEEYRGSTWTLDEICLFRGRPSTTDPGHMDLETYLTIPLRGS